MTNYSYFLMTSCQFTALRRWLDRLFEKNAPSREFQESLLHQAPVMKRASARDGKAQLCVNPWGKP
jgi:hypothetical protein